MRALYRGPHVWYSYCMPGARIYALVDPRCGEVRYVGKTAGTLEGRLKGHYARATTRTPVGAWLLKLRELGLEPGIIVLDDQPLDWQAAERRWIAHYRKRYPGKMKNVRDGGEGGGGWTASSAQLAEWGRRGAAATAASPNRRTVSTLGTLSPDARAKISAAHKGKPKSDEWKAKIRAAHAAKKSA